ncbi:MAG: four helix bundle protein [Cyclobacteriaceae bacterium]
MLRYKLTISSLLESFEELETWKLARQFKNEIKELTNQFPEQEKFRLTDQIIRSSRSVCANIAEGFWKIPL